VVEDGVSLASAPGVSLCCFDDAQRRRVLLTPEQASELYSEHMTKLFFPALVTHMSSGPVIVMQLAREKAVSYWCELIGPTNPLRARITHPNRSEACCSSESLRQL